MRVLLVGKGAPERGGIPEYLATLLESDLAEGHDLRFLNLAGHEVRQGGRVTAANLRRVVTDAVAVMRASGGCDVVHIHSALAPGSVLLRAGALAAAARARGARTIVHAHGGLLEQWVTSKVRTRLLRIVLGPAARIAAVSSNGHALLERALGPGRTVLVANGVDTERFRPGDAGHEPPRVVYVGGLTPRKGVLDLIAASRAARDRGLAHELWLVGGSPDEGDAAEAEVRAAVGDDILMLGRRDRSEMPGLYRECDVFCLPSWWEAMPLSVLEAMASGLPVVATTVGEMPRMVEDGRTGRLVAPRDRDALTAALVELLADAELRRRWGGVGRERACAHYSLAATIDAVGRLYEEIGR